MRSNMEYIGFKTRSCGIYKITNKINGKVYIGRTNNFHNRHRQHLYAYKKQDSSKSNQYLLNSYNKYGFNNFTFEEIYYCLSETESKVMEQYYMEIYNSFDSDTGYNLRKDTEGGMLISKATSHKITDRLKKEWESGIRDEHADKLKASWEYRDREAQSKLMSKTLTKYYYCIDNDLTKKLHYKDLVALGLSWAIGKFKRSNSDQILLKGFIVERFKYES